MNRNEIMQFITENQIDKNTSVVFSIMENGKPIKYKGRVEFTFNDTPAIKNDRIGIRIQMLKGAADMPYDGGIALDDLLRIEINE